jgi:hypothetical protein
VKFGNGEMQDLDEIRSELATYTQAITLSLNLVGLSRQGKVERYMENHGDELREIKASLNWVTAKFQVREGSKHGERSRLSSYEGDDEVWKMFKRELIHDGFSSQVLGRHKETIKKYVMELGARGVLDDVVPDQVSEDRPTEPASGNGMVLYGKGVSSPQNSGQFQRRSAASTSTSQNRSAPGGTKHHYTPPVWPDQASIERSPTSNSTSYTNGNPGLSQFTSSDLRAPKSSTYPGRTLKSVYDGELIQTTQYEKPVNTWGPVQITPHGKEIITAEWDPLQTVKFDLNQPSGTEDNVAGTTVCRN